MRIHLPALALLVAVSIGAQQPDKVVVFEGNTAGYKGYRIPALAVTTKGTLLAFCAARKELGDWADIDIALRRSTDGGRTWEPMRVIAERGSMTVDNPVPIVDRQTGAVHFLFQVNYAQLYYMRSDDDGASWSSPADITEVAHNFRRGWVSEGQKDRYGWNVVAPGPGHGLQLSSGRLLSAIWMSPQYRHRPSAVATVYSDDHGKTWKSGALVPQSLVNPSESVLAELADGRVMLNIRNEGDEHLRAVSYSPDGISSWTTPELHRALFEPVCMASLLRVGTVFLFANPGSRERSRDDLRLMLSRDEGKTWPVEKVLQDGGTGYSDMAAGKDGTVYVLYEHVTATGNGERRHSIDLARFNIDWLTSHK